MIKLSESTNNVEHTVDLMTNYIAPEIDLNIISDKNDVYSLGQMIYFIMNEKSPKMMNSDDNKRLINDYEFDKIYKMCINNDYKKRPSISKIMFLLLFNYQSKINISLIKDDLDVQFFNGIIDLKYEYLKKDINKLIHYYSFIANQDNTKAQYILGEIYFKGRYINRDIEKALHFYTLAADHYCEGSYINKAKYKIGKIYYEGKYVTRDMGKAIDYLSSSTNNPKALNILGDIYLFIRTICSTKYKFSDKLL